jgi:pyoverdine/dityrosine biosynthesis protein Dit1
MPPMLHLAADTSCESRLAAEILGIIMQHRRVAAEAERCQDDRCTNCLARHIDRVTAAIERNEPIVFVLPAFPGKSPNPAKVLGPRPDMAERQSLAFLDALCGRIQAIYPPGARVVLCSDGRVFSDVVGIRESDITTYQQDLLVILSELAADNLTTFNLDDVLGGSGFDAMRAHLMAEHGEPIEKLEAEARSGGDALRMYCGITRFLLEDAMRPGMALSKTALQKECRRRAYQVIQRSRAWDALIAKRFPEAVRLSIHPQGCGSRKIGIHLMETPQGTTDPWLTPWHCVAVEARGAFMLMKRSRAESMGAELVFKDGRPSHYLVAAAAHTEARQ